MADILIKNGYILSMDPDIGDIENGYILVKGKHIADIGMHTEETADKVIDAKGCIVMPGLVNTHSHSAMTLFRGYTTDMPLRKWLEEYIWPAESMLSPADIWLGSMAACIEMIRTGTTAFADMYFHTNQTAAAVEEAGLRASLSYGMIDQGDPSKAQSELDCGIRFAHELNGMADGRITTMYGPHAPNTNSRRFLQRISEQAQADGLGMHIHILESSDERKSIAPEMGVIRYLDALGFFSSPVLAAHCVWVDSEEIAILAERGVHVSHNVISNMKLASGTAPVAEMLAAGVNVSLGTDGCASNNNLDMFEEMKISALLQKVATGDPTVLNAREVLHMATTAGANGLGIQSGRLAVGCNADIILVDMTASHLVPAYDPASHLVYTASGQDVQTSIVDGRILMENRNLVTIDEEAVLNAVSRRPQGIQFRR